MKLIFIYGPPASGKFTVAKGLAKITGYKLFHNHLINDMLDEIIDSKKNFKEYWGEASYLKIRLVEKSAKLKIKGIIFTTVRVKEKNSDNLPLKMKKAVEKYGGKIYFIRLVCSDKEILKRVKGNSRKKYNNFSSFKFLKKFIKKHDVHYQLPFKNQLTINNNNLSAKKTALKIKEHFKLK